MAFDVLIRALFSDQGLSVGLAKANAGLAQLGRAGPGARRGLNAVEIGMRQLAFQATGLSGGLGTVARGLLSFGGGSALVLGAAAGIGAIALAFKAFTRESRENKQATDDLIKSLSSLGENAEHTAARIRAAGLGPMKRSEGVLSGFLGDMTGGLLGTTTAEQRERRQREISAATGATMSAATRAAAANAEANRKLGREPPLSVAERIEAGLQGGLANTIGRGLGLRMPTPQMVDVAAIQARAADPNRGFSGAGRFTPEMGLMLATSLAQGAQGGLPGLLGAASGPLSMLNPLAGGAVGFASSIAGLFDNSQAKHTDKIVRAIQNLERVLASPELLSPNYIGYGSPEAAMASNQRAARRDAINRTGARV